MSDLFYKTAFELSSLLERREISAEDLLRAVVARAEAVEDTVGAFLSWAERAHRLTSIPRRPRTIPRVVPQAVVPTIVTFMPVLSGHRRRRPRSGAARLFRPRAAPGPSATGRYCPGAGTQ